VLCMFVSILWPVIFFPLTALNGLVFHGSRPVDITTPKFQRLLFCFVSRPLSFPFSPLPPLIFARSFVDFQVWCGFCSARSVGPPLARALFLFFSVG